MTAISTSSDLLDGFDSLWQNSNKIYENKCQTRHSYQQSMQNYNELHTN